MLFNNYTVQNNPLYTLFLSLLIMFLITTYLDFSIVQISKKGLWISTVDTSNKYLFSIKLL